MPASSPSILFASSEAYPLIKTGGLADVSGALPTALKDLGLDVRLLLPGYPAVLAKCPDARPVASLPNPFAPGEVVILQARLPGSRVPLLIVAYDPFFSRAGGPYQDPAGRDWPDNALRFGLLSFVAAWLASIWNKQTWRPALVHCNDWQTGLAPAYLRFWPQPAPPTIMTIHNLAYQGVFGKEMLAPLALPPESFSIHGLEYYGNLSFLKAGVFYADYLTTVSPTYAEEIQRPELGMGMHGLLHERRDVLAGILNGIDTVEWDPATDVHLPLHYDATRLGDKARLKARLQAELGLDGEPDAPLVAVISRITYQKGSDVVLGVMHDLVREGLQFAVLGAGDHAIEQAYADLARAHPGRLAVVIGYDEGLSHRMEAGADMFLMPSRYEPCGLNQMYSQRYGTPPIVHRTGGLADTVVDAHGADLAAGRATGIVFAPVEHHACADAVRRAVALYRQPDVWRQMQRAGMACDFSWARSARAYHDLYRRVAARAA